MDDTVLEQLAMEARLRQGGARHRRQVAEQYVEQIVSSIVILHTYCFVYCQSVVRWVQFLSGWDFCDCQWLLRH